ncbi:MAG: hypothetical protein KAS13_03450 [Candidatus Omnitrophica bacterium]|nr:hypothetical protein [Candidatus Omnitrophota bacterium]
MDSKFFNGILVLLFPDSIFKKAVKDEDALKPLTSLLFSAFIFSALGIYVLKKFTYFKLNISALQVFLGIFFVFFVFILVTAFLSGLLNWVYSAALRIKKKKIVPDFLGSFCTHAYIVPLWMFLIFLHIVLYRIQDNVFLLILSIAVIIRFLDIEARLVKAVYKMRLMQGYMLVFLQTLLLFMGSFIGYALSNFINVNR